MDGDALIGDSLLRDRQGCRSVREAKLSQSSVDLRRMLGPRSIAVVGASDAPGNLGGTAVSYLQRFHYAGRILPVNPKREFVRGLPCVRSVSELQQPVDLAVLAAPSPAIPGLVWECAAVGIEYGVVWGGGFAEVGGQGIDLQIELAVACKDTGFRLLGPNCIGFINSKESVTATFASFLSEEDTLLPGTISMVSQSGGLATMLHALSQRASAGLRYMVSTGNEVSLTASDFIDALVDDEGTSVIACYLEGVADGEYFQRTLLKAQQAGKPVVILKGGLAPMSARAATAHTGALAGVGRVWQAVLSELGAVMVSSLEELLDVALFLSTEPGRRQPGGNRVAVVTFGGGGGVLATDQCLDAGLVPTPLSAQTREALIPLVPPIASRENPVDLTPQAFNDDAYLARLPSALVTVAHDEGIDIILCLFGPMATGLVGLINAVTWLHAQTDKTVCIAWPLGPKGSYELMREHGIHVFADSAPAIVALSKIFAATSPSQPAAASVTARTLDWGSLVPKVAAGTVVPEHLSHRILRAAALPTSPGTLVTNEGELLAAVQEVGLPVAMKAVSGAVTHRDVAGLVRLNVSSEDEAINTFATILKKSLDLAFSLEGVYVQRMVLGGEEILVSAFRDPTFGHMVSCGAGGTRTELLNDLVLARAPVTPEVAIEHLRRLRIVRFAMESGCQIEPLASFVAAVSELGVSAPWQQFTFEINPVMWRTGDVVAVDGLLVIEVP
jgi:acetate---CoA ligase (ADP-forming)